MNITTVSTPGIYAIVSYKEFLELDSSITNHNELVLISITEPVEQGWEDTMLPPTIVDKYKSALQVKFWDIVDPIGNYTPIDDNTAQQIQNFILANKHNQFIIHCRAGQSRSAAVGKAIECIKHFGIGEQAVYNYRTSYHSPIDDYARYSPNPIVFDKIVKDN